MSRLYVGTSGWNYDHWKDNFYAGVRRKDWLGHYARQFGSVEVNATFYRLQEKKTFERWRDESPPDFRFALKGNRFLTDDDVKLFLKSELQVEDLQIFSYWTA